MFLPLLLCLQVQTPPLLKHLNQAKKEAKICLSELEECQLTCSPSDAGVPDSGPVDAGEPDAGTPDAGAVDGGQLDAGAPDIPDLAYELGTHWPPPPMPLPDVGTLVEDPTFGTAFYRLPDGVRHIYSQLQPFSADNSRMIGFDTIAKLI